MHDDDDFYDDEKSYIYNKIGMHHDRYKQLKEEGFINHYNINQADTKNIVNTKNKNDYKFISKTKAVDINDINYSNDQRIFFSENEINRVLGGGLVKGSVVLISGEPGIGKSTILLQNSLSSSEKVLYISGEESSSQIKLRAHRITDNLNNCFILTETNLELILKN